jgi:tRNA(Ile)-lysidine synthase
MSPTPVLLGLSGGLDSTVLLHALAQLPAQREAGLRAIHVHHGLHASADDWADHCVRLCAALGVSLRVVRVDVERGAGKGLEAAARAARYAAFAAELHAGEVLATAHHLDDQAETFLLRALRASGPDGLAAMQEWRVFGLGHRHWRPLLSLRRDELLAHASLHDLRWIEDPSNADQSLDRNFLRLHVMPVLRQRWPHADAALARSAALSGEASALLGIEDAQALAMAATLDPHVLRIAQLQALPSARLARVLRLWVSNLQLSSLPGIGVHQVATDLIGARADARARFVWGNACIQRWRDLLHAGMLREPLPLAWEAHWNGSGPLALPGGGTLTLQGGTVPARALIAHARRGGERIRLPGRAHSHSLKRVLQDLGVPPWERSRLPLLSDGDGQLLAAGDLVYSADFDDWLRANRGRLVWRDAA